MTKEILDKLLSNLDVRVEPFSRCIVSPGWRLFLPAPPGVVLHFVLRGEGVLRGPGGEAHELGPCSLAVVPVGAAHSLEACGEVRHEHRIELPRGSAVPPSMVAGPGDEPALVIACGLVEVRLGESLGLFDHLREMRAVDLSECPEVQQAFHAILEEQSRPRPGSEAMKAALMSQCLVHLLRRLLCDAEGSLPWLAVLQHPQVARAVERILDDPAGRYTVDSLAELASMSRSAFAQRFVAAFGLPPMRLVHLLRMQRAARLLRQGKVVPIDAVASRVGFSSRSHFSRAFKKHYGISPADLRAG